MKSERLKVIKEIGDIHTQQLMNNYECEDLYPIDSDVLTYAYKYIPVKILKAIIKMNKEDKWKRN